MTIDEAEKIKNVVENKNGIVQLVNTAAKTLIEAFEHIKIEDVNMFRIGYNKAIDDFANRLSSKIKYEIDDCADELRWIEEIAKQLKGGGVDG